MSEACPICGAPEGSPARLVEHLRTAHKHDDPARDVEMNPEAHTPGVVCALCGERFATPKELAAHNLRPHPEPKDARSAADASA
jgi:hypothetical protein